MGSKINIGLEKKLIGMLQLWFVANTILWPFIIKLGGLSLGLNVEVLFVAGMIFLGKDWRITVSSAKVFLAFLVCGIFSLFIASAGPCEDHLQKSILTLPILLFLVLVGLEVGHRASDRDWCNLQKTAPWVLLVAFVAFIVEVLFPTWFPLQAGYRREGKLSGLFSEPSHVAFSLFPCIVVLLVADEKRTRQKGVLALLGLLVYSRSSTLLVFIAAWILYRLFVQRKVRQAALAGFTIALFVTLAATVDYERFIFPIAVRIGGIVAPDDQSNVSSLVYLQGWQDTWSNLSRTHGVGLGLNMMGCSPLPDVPARYALDQLYNLGTLNAEDGSFMFSKIVSEIGLVGIFLYFALIWWWIRLERKIRHSSNPATNYAAAAQTALIFCFVTSSFVRSANYFNGGFLLWIATMAGAAKSQRYLSLKAEPRKDQSTSALVGLWLYRVRALTNQFMAESGKID